MAKKHKRSKGKKLLIVTVPKGTRVKIKRKKSSHNPIVLQAGRTRVGIGTGEGKGLAKWIPKIKVRRLPSKGRE